MKRAISTIFKLVQECQIDEQFDLWILYTEGEENCDALEAMTSDWADLGGTTIKAQVQARY